MRCDVRKFKAVYGAFERRELTNREAAFLLGYSEAYFKQLRRRYRRSGGAVFVHGLKGRAGNNRISTETERRIVGLYNSGLYFGVNFSFFRYLLERDEGIEISYYGLRSVLMRNGVEPPIRYRVKKKPEHRPRPPKSHEGELVQMDATPYQWLSCFGDTGYYNLHGAIDDATSKVVGLYMCENECSYGYFEVLAQMSARYGLPCADYTDRLKFFDRSKAKPTLEEQLQGLKCHKTQWIEMCEALGITHILAYSSQAKGRIERLWETVKQRLPFEIQKRRLDTVDKINAYLPVFIEEHNAQFSHQARFGVPLWRKPPSDFDYWLSKHDTRMANGAGIISYGGLKLLVTEPNCARRAVRICITVSGIFTYANGMFYPVKAIDEFENLADRTPDMLKAIIYDSLYKSLKDNDEVLTA